MAIVTPDQNDNNIVTTNANDDRNTEVLIHSDQFQDVSGML